MNGNMNGNMNSIKAPTRASLKSLQVAAVIVCTFRLCAALLDIPDLLLVAALNVVLAIFVASFGEQLTPISVIALICMCDHAYSAPHRESVLHANLHS